jgi:hypothetical protein
MKWFIMVATSVWALLSPGLSAGEVPWQHGTYHGYPYAPDYRFANPVQGSNKLAQANPTDRANHKVNNTSRQPLCYRFKFDEDLQFIRCY